MMSESAAHSLHSLQTSRLPSLITFLCLLANVVLNVYSDLGLSAQIMKSTTTRGGRWMKPVRRTAHAACAVSVPFQAWSRLDMDAHLKACGSKCGAQAVQYSAIRPLCLSA